MSESNNILGVCCRVKQEEIFRLDSLKRYFKDYLELISIDPDNIPTLPVPPKAIIASWNTTSIMAENFPDSKIIHAGRTITGYNLEEVFKIPAGTYVLVVNFPESTAHETIEGLRSLGIKHLHLVPYWPGCGMNTSGFDFAIYAGIKSYCPKNIKNYIDIGNRNFTVSTLMSIIQTYDLPLILADHIQDDYMKIIVKGSYRIEATLRETKTLKDNLELVCNMNNSISIKIDHTGFIQVFNPAAEEFFGIPKISVIGKSYRECFKYFTPLMEIIEKEQNVYETVINIKNQELVATINILQIDGHSHTVLNLTPVHALQRTEAKVRSKLHSKGFTAKYHFEDIKGESAIIRKAVNLAKNYAHTDATVILTGESGTGKELFAQSIHNASKRFAAPFVGINFAALPETLAESELFGYAEGAFTGASKSGKPGMFEIAHGGTIFLDEIGDASLSLQTKLLRVLEEREIVRIGSSSVLPINVRVICATNKDLLNLIKKGGFREDLYYRITVLALQIPSLRERKEDIMSILNSSSQFRQIAKILPNNFYERIMQYNWPGNIRELKSVMEYLSILEQYPDKRSSEFITFANDLINQFFANKIPYMDISSSNEPKTAATDLLVEEFLEYDLFEILKQIVFLNKRSVPAGRCSLAELEPLKKLNLTEAKIKIRLKRLEERGYITIGKTKQGVTLTGKALAMLKRPNPPILE